jgi:hypothetical protein
MNGDPVNKNLHGIKNQIDVQHAQKKLATPIFG